MHNIAKPKRPSGRRAPAQAYNNNSRRADIRFQRKVIEDAIFSIRELNEQLTNADPATKVPDDAKGGQYEVLEQLYGRSRVQFTNGTLSAKKGVKMVYNREMPALTADLVVLSPNKDWVLLIKRKRDPYQHFWAIPGGFVDMDKQETAHAAAIREFKEEAGQYTVIDPRSVFHVFTATYPDRDPRQRTISVLFTTELKDDDVKGGSADPEETTTQQWFPVSNVLSGKLAVAFDHKSLIARAYLASVGYENMRPDLVKLASNDL